MTMHDSKREMASGRLPPDPVIEAYKKDVDRTLIRENLRLTPDERVRKMLGFRKAAEQVRGAARRHHG